MSYVPDVINKTAPIATPMTSRAAAVKTFLTPSILIFEFFASV
jgi:hypothetical protein